MTVVLHFTSCQRLECFFFNGERFLIIRCLFGPSVVHWVFYSFHDTDSGLRFGQRNRFLLRQWLCRLLHRRDLDGAADLAAHAANFRVRSAHDHAAKHHGSIRRPQRSIDFSASVGVKLSQTHTLLQCLLADRGPWRVPPRHVAFVCLSLFSLKVFVQQIDLLSHILSSSFLPRILPQLSLGRRCLARHIPFRLSTFCAKMDAPFFFCMSWFWVHVLKDVSVPPLARQGGYFPLK